MKLSKKGIYALKSMIDIGLYGKKENVTISNISERQNIGVSSLEQIFPYLKKSKLVISQKGSRGGYILSKPSNKIFVFDIIKSVEGKVSITENYNINNSIIRSTIQVELFDEIDKAIEESLLSMTLEDLEIEYIKHNNLDNYMFFI